MVPRNTSNHQTLNAGPAEATQRLQPLPDAGIPDGTIAFTSLAKQLGREAALEVLSSFVGFAAASAVELRAAIDKQDWKQTRALLRELTHSAKIVGAAHLLRACTALEADLEKPDAARLRGHVTELSRQAKAVSRKLHQLLS